jgi:hypothetical protein
VLFAVVHKMPARPSSLAELHADVDLCLAIGLAKSPGDRFPSGAAFAAALAEATRGALAAPLRKRAEGLLRKQPWDA